MCTNICTVFTQELYVRSLKYYTAVSTITVFYIFAYTFAHTLISHSCPQVFIHFIHSFAFFNCGVVFLLKLKGHIAVSVTLYPKHLPIDLCKLFPVMVSV